MSINIFKLKEKIANKEEISNVDISKMTNFEDLFMNDETFNQNISKWDVSNVQDMSYMFFGSNFNRNIFNWKFSKIENIDFIFFNSKFDKNIFNFKNIKIKGNKIFSKHINFIKHNMVVGEYE